ncbi:MAG: helix-turn-helix domain-containing protein [Oscillospiraceae bacterium]|nr:helix-turn-helix domain-containing protein [Oscillospiraceae bacterium]
MNENILSTNIARLRKEHALTQDALAGKLGVTYQAVSKWENGASCPDVMLLPEIADIFNVTVDNLFGHETPVIEAPPAPTAEFLANVPCGVPWDDDGKLRVVLFQGSELLQAINEETLNKIKEVPFVYNGPALNISSALNIYCNKCDIGGDVSAAGNVFCGDVSGDVSSHGSVECSDVSGNVEAQGSVKCSDISGNASAGGNISCADISGNASCGGEFDCGDIGGNASCGGNLTCDEIRGDASCGCDITCDEINGDVTCNNVVCDEINGNVYAQGTVKCDHMSGDVYGAEVNDDDLDDLDDELDDLEDELRDLEEDLEYDNKPFSIKIDFDTNEFKSNVKSLARKAEKIAQIAVSASKDYIDQIKVAFTSADDGTDDDEHITDIINAEIDASIDEAMDSGDYSSIDSKITERMNAIGDKINRYFSDKYNK